MIEPVQGEGGVHPATQEFIEGLRKLCDERGMLLLLDEVQTGWGRTGSPMAFMGYGVKPDCVTMAKAMGGGMPIGACCASEEVAAVLHQEHMALHTVDIHLHVPHLSLPFLKSSTEI